jgi:parallel beta-helix repeat protein
MRGSVFTVAALALTASVLGVGASPTAATVACDRYASTAGSDSAAGTASTPFRTAQKLMNSLTAGQTGCLATGTYTEDLRVNHGGSPGSPVRLTSVPDGRATIVGRLYVPDESNDVVFSDLDLDGTNASNLPSPTVDGDRVTFTGDDVTDSHHGICFSIGSLDWGTAVDTVLDGNRIHDCGRLPYGSTNHDHGIYVESARGTVITNNYIYDNADRGVQLYPDAQGSRITNNVIDGNGEGIIFSGDSGRASSGNVATRNIISNALVRYNVEAWWPDGNPVGTGNLANDNCLWNGKQGNVDDQVGFSASGNRVANPQFASRGTKNFALQSGSPCSGYGPKGTSAPAPPTPPSAPPVSTSTPTNTGLPAISGRVKPGSKLTASTGGWSGTGPLAFGFSWQRCDRHGKACVATGTTSASYLLAGRDAGHTLRVVVKAQNAAGSSSAASAATATVKGKKRPKGVRSVLRHRRDARRALMRLVHSRHLRRP